MKQQIMTEPGKIIFRDIEVPVPKDNEVLVAIKRIGVCGSDIHVYHGTHPFTSYPITQGHEVSGEIVEVGKDVKDLKVGQKVTIEPQWTCGECHPCRHGKYNLCEDLKVMGFQAPGTAQEFFAVDASKITPVPEEMSFDQAAMIEPLAVAVHAARRFPELEGAKAVVEGAGPIGILTAQTLKALGADEVLITDVSDGRLELAKSLGIDYAVNTKDKDFNEVLLETFGPDKADVIYDCAGNDITMNNAIRYARKGSTIILVAVFGKMANADLAVLNDHELDLNTTMMYTHPDYLEAIELVKEGKVRLEPLMSKHFPFEDYQKAYEYIDNNREGTMKVLIDVAD